MNLLRTKPQIGINHNLTDSTEFAPYVLVVYFGDLMKTFVELKTELDAYLGIYFETALFSVLMFRGVCDVLVILQVPSE